jgi:hypothetical protein
MDDQELLLTCKKFPHHFPELAPQFFEPWQTAS